MSDPSDLMSDHEGQNDTVHYIKALNQIGSSVVMMEPKPQSMLDMFHVVVKELNSVKNVCRRLNRQIQQMEEDITRTDDLMAATERDMDVIVRDVQSQVGGSRLKVVIEGYLSMMGWEGDKRAAFVNALKEGEIPLFTKKEMTDLEKGFAVENNNNSSHRLPINVAYETVIFRFQNGHMDEGAYLAFTGMLLVLIGYDPQQISENLLTPRGRNLIHKILKGSKELIVPSRPKIARKTRDPESKPIEFRGRGKWINTALESKLTFKRRDFFDLVWEEDEDEVTEQAKVDLPGVDVDAM